jgi:hypothetical protein
MGRARVFFKARKKKAYRELARVPVELPSWGTRPIDGVVRRNGVPCGPRPDTRLNRRWDVSCGPRPDTRLNRRWDVSCGPQLDSRLDRRSGVPCGPQLDSQRGGGLNAGEKKMTLSKRVLL